MQVLERWNFDIETDKESVHNPEKEFDKSEKDIMSEIQAIIRQITASVTFLPLLQDACTFDLLVRAQANALPNPSPHAYISTNITSSSPPSRPLSSPAHPRAALAATA